MASVKKLLDEKGRRRGDRVRWRTGAGAPRTRTFLRARGETEADARAWAVKVESDKHRGAELDDRPLTVAAWRERWQALQVHAEGSRLRVNASLDPLERLLGDRLLTSIRPSDMAAWKQARLERISPATLRAEWTWVHGLFKAALADRLIAFDPCVGIRLESPQARRVVVAEEHHITAISAGLPAHYRFLPLLGARTGLRPAELLGLHTEQVDFLRLQIKVDRQLVRGRVSFVLKTPESRRTVPVLEETTMALAAHLAAFPASPDGLIFHARDGSPLEHRAVNDTWKRVAARVGANGLRLHDMRHFYASQLLNKGMDMVAVSHYLGHSSPSITADIYAHVTGDSEHQVRAALERIFGSK